MSGSFSRRRFLSRGATVAGGAVVLGGGGGFLAACGSSGSTKAGSTGTGGSTGSSTAGVGKGTPKKGGTLNVGVEAEDNGFNPTVASWDVTGLMYGACLFDTLAVVDVNGKAIPYLALSITPNADNTVWTIKLRSTPISFHDGSALDSNAVVGSMEANIHSPQNGPGLTNVASVTNPDAATVVVTCKEPWVALPYYLTGPFGLIMAPAMLKEPNSGNLAPIGTGPFKFGDWTPNDHLRVVRNPSYWLPNLPYLDTVVFHPIPDHQSRENSLKAGTIDIMHTDDTQTAVDFMHNASYQYINDLGNNATEHEQDFLMINTASPPLDNLTVRQALAYSLNRQAIINTEYNGISPNANGPYSKGSPYYIADTGYPDYNLAKAQSLMKQAAQQLGGPVKFTLSIINDAKDLAVIELAQGMFQAAGAQVTIQQVQQSQYIVQALLGQYQVRGWRQFAASDPDQNYVWWSSKTAAPIGSLALNFARNKDPQVDSALEMGRTHSDQATRSQAYQTISKQFGADVPYLWINQAYWSVIAKPSVQNFNNGVAPDGSTQLLKMTGGFFDPRFIWLG
ncbi:MAG TPA: ABC transporter substrate-binding protein [Acidimicrobiales bacterium]|nr:ABC transporter substrate-binding protein [Acidimicrobiales bacterium]